MCARIFKKSALCAHCLRFCLLLIVDAICEYQNECQVIWMETAIFKSACPYLYPTHTPLQKAPLIEVSNSKASKLGENWSSRVIVFSLFLCGICIEPNLALELIPVSNSRASSPGKNWTWWMFVFSLFLRKVCCGSCEILRRRWKTSNRSYQIS